MKTVLRERLLEQQLCLPGVYALYAKRDGRFVEQAKAWLKDVETVLAQFRQASAGRAARYQAMITAAQDGYQNPAFPTGSGTKRKTVSVAAYEGLVQVENLLAEQLASIEQELAPFREKMQQLVSVAYTLGLIPASPAGVQDRTAWLKGIWRDCGEHPNLKAMYIYLNVALTTVDRLYLLDDCICNFEANGNS